MEFQRHDKVVCRILNYIPRERSFEVEDVVSYTKGWVIFVNHYDDIPPMKEAYNNHETLPLFFDRYENGVPIFAYKLYKDRPQKMSENTDVEVDNSELTIKMSFSNLNLEFSTQVFNALFNSLGESIDTEEKYNIAKQLLLINRKLKVRKWLSKDLFKISNATFQTKFWNDGLLPYFSNIGIKKTWESSDEEGRESILQRLGIILPKTSNTQLECFFEGIEEVVLKNIISAQTSIKACMAWFTNFNIFKALRHKLKEGVEIVMITNNDLINNGGYCLNLNELIDKGLKLHLAEYPDLIHHKFCIIDGKVVMTGSYNWTFFSENINRENMIVIKDDPSAIESYNAEFELLVGKYGQVSQMPENVPERPEYDRSSFKQYISEELVLRSKKKIGNIKENIVRAKALSPNYEPVLQAISAFHIVEDNSSLTVEQMESTANSNAIAERRLHIANLNQRQENLNEQRESLEQESVRIQQQQEEVTEQALHIAKNGDITEAERERRQESVRVQSKDLAARQKQIATRISQVISESSTIEQSVNTAEAEINVIQNTSQIATEGGRGSLKINLKWNTYDDLDLHVFDPDGFEIYYGKKQHQCQEVLGQLDIDANAGSSHTRTPQENIFWEDGKNAPVGHYRVSVVYYSKKDTFNSVPFTVTVYPGKGESKVFTGIVYNAKDRREIIEFDYSEKGISYKE